MMKHKYDDIKIGSPAELVFRRIIEHHKQIKTFTVFTYDLHINSGDELQTVGMRPMRRKDLKNDGLRRWSDQNHLIVREENDEEGQEKEFGMAIASVVKMYDGSIKHIPMLDFESRSKSQFILNPRRISNILRPFPGFLLETGDSLHFWGINLLSPRRWEKFLTFANDKFNDDEIDRSFIEFSEKRRFSGLRIYNYGDIKRTAPYVVAKV